jgi:aspartyl-tRNA(Asn)/glutamyl-tRNA(Gln) amidotransferase subunit A
MSALYELGIEGAAAGLAAGAFSSVELTQAVIDRVKAEDPKIGAYLTFDEEGALAAARAADARRAAGEKGALLGVPIAIKDLINVRGQPCTCASKILEGYVSPYDATVIERLKAAAEESKAQIQSGMEDVIKEVEGKCRELESSFFDLQMENLQLKKELDKYKNGTGGF